MRSRKLFLLFAVLWAIQQPSTAAWRWGATVQAQPAPFTTEKPDEPTGAVSRPAHMPASLKRMPVVAQAYLDAWSVLSEENKCSNFFGGSRASLTVLQELVGRLKAKHLDDPTIGITMKGEVNLVHNMSHRFSYRLFDETLVNTAGPFSNDVRPLKVSIGSLPAHSREARALMLLHELGHLMIGVNGKPLLPNDGGEDGYILSLQNNQIIEHRCGEQVRRVRESDSLMANTVKRVG